VANRHALLIGVPTYDEREFNRDERLAAAVRADVGAMRDALAQSDYQISECGLDSQATGNRIKGAIKEACKTAPAGGVLLIYFSGHGVSAEGADYLVPADAFQTNGLADTDSLVEVIPRKSLLTCPARLVVFFVDACRDDPARPRPASALGGDWPFPPNGQFVLVMGCAAGQVCQYDENGSTFTAALTKSLDPRDSARTLSDVVSAVSKDMRQRSRQRPDMPQEPVVRYPDVLELVGGQSLCAGDELTDAWIRAVEASPLLPVCAAGGLAERVREVVRDCAGRTWDDQQWLASRTGLADPWTDQDYPGRVLDKTALLLGLSPAAPERPGLTAGEAALLIAAPFLRETVIAAGIREAAGIDPANLDRTYIPGARTDLELTHEMRQHLVRRATGLREGGRTIASDQLAMWLVHQWLTTWVLLWETPAAAAVYTLAAPLVEGHLGNASPGDEQHSLVRALLLAVEADPADERLIRLLGKRFIDDRWRGMAAVLWLAGIMAGDPRRLPAVVPDLVGTGIELPPGDVQDASRQAQWLPPDAAPDTLDLFLVCEHPALHDAFDNIVKRADLAREVIEVRLRLPATISERLPRRFTAHRLRPRERKVGYDIDVVKKAYEVPLSRFQIAEEKVRELLMGRQLYGDPALAIRELYQNALDACRWRQTRFDYLTAKEKEPRPWSGLIRFTQGTDPDGRPYIECEDNGVGMDFATLKHVFANAGERFVFGREFRAEQASWAELDPPLRMVSNSQFGIGVFSYFMLADEITVTTRHQGRDGQVAHEAYEVSIVSSGSLIQIGPGVGLPEGGTRVRLYLNGDATDVSVLDTLRGFLRVAEHRVEVADQTDSDAWLAGELGSEQRKERDSRDLLHVPPVKCGRDVWWVRQGGGLIADGIDVDQRMFGLVVNLREEHRPQFTVDRNQVRSWDSSWVAAQARAAIPSLLSWPGFTFPWLWDLAGDDLGLAQCVFEQAVAADKHLAVSTGSAEREPVSPPVPLRVIGCVPADSSAGLRGGYASSEDGPRWFATWRAGTWRSFLAGWADQPAGHSCTPEVTEGFPVADPFDSVILTAAVESSHAPSIPRLLQASSVPVTVRSWRRRLRRYAITGLDVSAVRPLPPLDVLLDDLSAEQHSLLSALDAWSPPGEPARRELTISLVTAAAELELPLGEVLRRVQALAPADWSAPEIELGEYADRPLDPFEVALLDVRRDYGGARPLVTPTISYFVSMCAELKLSIDEGLAACERLRTLGLNPPWLESWSRGWGDSRLSDVERRALSYLDRPGQLLNLPQLLLIAEHEPTVGEAYAGLTRLQDQGMLVLSSPGPFAQRRLARQPRAWLTTRGRRSPSGFGTAADQMALCLQVTRAIAKPLGTDTRDLYEFARDLAPFTAPVRPFTWPEIVDLAHQLKMSLGQSIEELRAVYPQAQTPALPAECADLTVSAQVARTLIDQSGETSWRLGPGMIVRGALDAKQPLADFVAGLAPFAQLGAPVPALGDVHRDQLTPVDIDAYDADMLLDPSDDNDSPSLRSIDALTLVQIAGRLGWTPAHAHWRLSRLAPLGLTLGYDVPARFPEQLVYWHDLQALTTYFDGQAPAISGRIDWPCLENAAEEIFDCPPGEATEKAAFLRDRLRPYAALFALELPEESPGAETAVD
jgi:hypothetical protein